MYPPPPLRSGRGFVDRKTLLERCVEFVEGVRQGVVLAYTEILCRIRYTYGILQGPRLTAATQLAQCETRRLLFFPCCSRNDNLYSSPMQGHGKRCLALYRENRGEQNMAIGAWKEEEIQEVRDATAHPLLQVVQCHNTPNL
nr:hypothetical protein CFP56_23911 [Quercus suber]